MTTLPPYLKHYPEVTQKQYSDLKEEAEKTYNISIQRLNAYLPLLKIANDLCLQWSSNTTYVETDRYADTSYAFDIGTIECLSINLYLAKSDSLKKDVGLILDNLYDNAEFEFMASSESIMIKWKSWRFNYLPTTYKGKYSNDGIHPQLMVRGFYEHSEQCRLLPTGEFTEVQKLVCD